MGQMRNPFEGVLAVLFDMDGTLVETNIDFPLMKREMTALAERYKIPKSEVRGLDILGIVDYITDHRPGAEAPEIRQTAMERLEQIELAHSREATPIPGAVELLQGLADQGIKYAIVTRNCRSAVTLSLETSGIAADVLLTRDDVERVKPHPGHLLKALEILGVRSENALTVGDHWMDVLAGKAAGTKTVGFLRARRREDFFDSEPPDFIIKDLAELLDYIERLKI